MTQPSRSGCKSGSKRRTRATDDGVMIAKGSGDCGAPTSCSFKRPFWIHVNHGGVASSEASVHEIAQGVRTCLLNVYIPDINKRLLSIGECFLRFKSADLLQDRLRHLEDR